MNCRGSDIYCRPVDEGGGIRWLLLDDVHSALQPRLEAAGAIAIVCTSQNNLQAWFELSQPASPQVARATAEELAVRFGGDLRCAANPAQLGRLPGFVNRKPLRQKNGVSPLCRLVFAGAKSKIEPAGEGHHVAPTPHAIPAGVRKHHCMDRSAVDYFAARRLAEGGAGQKDVYEWLLLHSAKAPGDHYYCDLTARNATAR
jgi:hypothetical protein